MSKRSRIVRRRMRAHENIIATRRMLRRLATISPVVSFEDLGQMFRGLYPDGVQIVTVDGTKGVVSSQVFKFDNDALEDHLCRMEQRILYGEPTPPHDCIAPGCCNPVVRRYDHKTKPGVSFAVCAFHGQTIIKYGTDEQVREYVFPEPEAR